MYVSIAVGEIAVRTFSYRWTSSYQSAFISTYTTVGSSGYAQGYYYTYIPEAFLHAQLPRGDVGEDPEDQLHVRGVLTTIFKFNSLFIIGAFIVVVIGSVAGCGGQEDSATRLQLR